MASALGPSGLSDNSLRRLRIWLAWALRSARRGLVAAVPLVPVVVAERAVAVCLVVALGLYAGSGISGGFAALAERVRAGTARVAALLEAGRVPTTDGTVGWAAVANGSIGGRSAVTLMKLA